LWRVAEFMDAVIGRQYNHPTLAPTSSLPAPPSHLASGHSGTSFMPRAGSASVMHGAGTPFSSFCGVGERYDGVTTTGSDSGLIGYSRGESSPNASSYSPQATPQNSNLVAASINEQQQNNTNNSNVRSGSATFPNTNGVVTSTYNVYSTSPSFTNMTNSSPTLIAGTPSTDNVIFPSHSPGMNSFQPSGSSSSTASSGAILSFVQSPLISAGKPKSAFAPVLRPNETASPLSSTNGNVLLQALNGYS